MRNIRFDDDTIQEVFGHEAAEDDNIERLKKYYFKNTAYERLNTGTSLRILIGHKGIGKSAMLAVAAQEDATYNRLAIMLRPDDIDELPLESTIKIYGDAYANNIRATILGRISTKVDDKKFKIKYEDKFYKIVDKSFVRNKTVFFLEMIQDD